MALKDCFKRLGKAISAEDRAQIESDVAAGMGEIDAVRAALQDSSQDLLAIVEQIYEAGGEIQRKPNPLVDAREIQVRNLEKLQRERAAIQEKMSTTLEKLQDIEAIENFVANYPDRREFFVAAEIDLSNPQHLNRILSAMLFDPNQRPILEAGRLGLKGDSPIKLVNSFRALQQKAFGLHAKLRAYQEQNAAIDDRIRTVFHGERRNPVLDHKGEYIVMEPIRPPGRPTSTAQQDLFADADVTKSQRENEAKANYKARVRNEEVGTMRTGLNVVKSAEDAAHVMAPIRRSATEGMWALILDENDQVISAVRHAIGTYDGTSVYPNVLAGAILSTEGARKVWFAHNHPSGVSSPSTADQHITKKLVTTLLNTDVEVAGHVIIGSGGREYTALGSDGTVSQQAGQPIKPLARRMEVPITERILRSHINDAETISSPAHAERIMRELDPPDGLLLIDNRHRVLGFLEMDSADMLALKTTKGHQRLLQAFSELGAAAGIVHTHTDDQAIFENMTH